ncbi:unnamed protein product [Prunus armeniaca]|uniref:Uncharacterized protein n=1 Tax=Prunus armeniaca TaxID=36596 RepID=A0A6J5VMJ6_PRUAR|nr:unnamed protein product [Prunus armeniaca]
MAEPYSTQPLNLSKHPRTLGKFLRALKDTEWQPHPTFSRSFRSATLGAAPEAPKSSNSCHNGKAQLKGFCLCPANIAQPLTRVCAPGPAPRLDKSPRPRTHNTILSEIQDCQCLNTEWPLLHSWPQLQEPSPKLHAKCEHFEWQNLMAHLLQNQPSPETMPRSE